MLVVVVVVHVTEYANTISTYSLKILVTYTLNMCLVYFNDERWSFFFVKLNKKNHNNRERHIINEHRELIANLIVSKKTKLRAKQKSRNLYVFIVYLMPSISKTLN